MLNPRYALVRCGGGGGAAARTTTQNKASVTAAADRRAYWHSQDRGAVMDTVRDAVAERSLYESLNPHYSFSSSVSCNTRRSLFTQCRGIQGGMPLRRTMKGFGHERIAKRISEHRDVVRGAAASDRIPSQIVRCSESAIQVFRVRCDGGAVASDGETVRTGA